MDKTQYDMIYLSACGVNGVSPGKEHLTDVDILALYQLSHMHQIEALVGIALQKAGIPLPKGWAEQISKVVRKTVLFEAERAKLLSFMEQEGIWYLPLKGIILMEYYPMVGMRQMSDNDILFDERFAGEVGEYMKSQGYEAASVGTGNHDVYKKLPVYNFEMHRALYGVSHQKGWEEYYRDVKDRLILDQGSSYGYHFTDEDFYVYIVSHAYKHYAGSGTGLRTLLDFYVYLKAKEQDLDFAYIERECEVLGIAGFERLNRSLCRKVFGEPQGVEKSIAGLTEEELEMLEYYLACGVYGTTERGVKSRIQKYREKSGKDSKLGYVLSRVFSTKDIYRNWPIVRRYKWLLPFAWLYRLIRPLFNKKQREKLQQELDIVKKYE